MVDGGSTQTHTCRNNLGAMGASVVEHDLISIDIGYCGNMFEIVTL